MRSRFPTPWKKSRTFGDIYGGRRRRRMSDNIFARLHSLQAPIQNQPLPILIQDNPSREYFFPVSAEEFASALSALPSSHSEGITHIWLRRLPSVIRPVDLPLAQFICGSGVRAIVIYPWRVDGKLYLGQKRPTNRTTSFYLRFGASIDHEKGKWYVHFSHADLRKFYVKALFCHEVGHHVDWYNRHWSKSNKRQTEEFADQYAVQWGADAMMFNPDF